MPPTVEVSTSPGSGRPRICCARARFTRDFAVSAYVLSSALRSLAPISAWFSLLLGVIASVAVAS